MKSQIEIHDRENSKEAETFLNENRDKFSNQCLLVLKILYSGVRLTVEDALVKYKIASLPRRIGDIREAGITIVKDEWVKDENGKRLYKQWYIEIPKPPTKQSVIAQQLSLI